MRKFHVPAAVALAAALDPQSIDNFGNDGIALSMLDPPSWPISCQNAADTIAIDQAVALFDDRQVECSGAAFAVAAGDTGPWLTGVDHDGVTSSHGLLHAQDALGQSIAMMAEPITIGSNMSPILDLDLDLDLNLH